MYSIPLTSTGRAFPSVISLQTQKIITSVTSKHHHRNISVSCSFTHLMVSWHCWSSSLARVTSCSFSRARVPMVRWSLVGFWKIPTSTPASCEHITRATTQTFQQNLKCIFLVVLRQTDLAAALQHLLSKAHKPFLHLRMIQCQRQKVGERLLPSKAFNQNLNAGYSGDHRGPLSTCDH